MVIVPTRTDTDHRRAEFSNDLPLPGWLLSITLR